MTRYLVDTNVILATAPTAGVTRPELIEWMDAHSAALFLSAVTIAEIADGIAKARREGATRKASGLSAWLRALLHLYAERVLPFDVPTAEIAGALSDLARGAGNEPGSPDERSEIRDRLRQRQVCSRMSLRSSGLQATDFRSMPNSGEKADMARGRRRANRRRNRRLAVAHNKRSR